MGGVGAGSNSGSQSGTQSGTYDNTGKSTNLSQVGTSGQSNGYTSAATTGIFDKTTRNAAGSVNSDGLTGGQQKATDFLSGTVSGQPMGYALQGVNGQIDQATAGGAPQVTAQQVGAQTGASLASPYAKLYSQELIDPALKQFDYGQDRATSALDARTAAGGGFANERSGLAYSDLAAQGAASRGALEAQLKGQGLDKSFSLGSNDASRYLSADQSNAANALTASGQNATNALSSQINRLTGLGMKAGNDVSTNTMGTDNAKTLYNMSGGGVNNNLAIAGSQTPAFGTISGNSNTGSTTGLNVGDTTNTGSYSGQSQGTSSGSQQSGHIGK